MRFGAAAIVLAIGGVSYDWKWMFWMALIVATMGIWSD